MTKTQSPYSHGYSLAEGWWVGINKETSQPQIMFKNQVSEANKADEVSGTNYREGLIEEMIPELGF